MLCGVAKGDFFHPGLTLKVTIAQNRCGRVSVSEQRADRSSKVQDTEDGKEEKRRVRVGEMAAGTDRVWKLSGETDYRCAMPPRKLYTRLR